MTASRPAHAETLSLTGLRGIAALFVLVAHYATWCAPYDLMTAPEWLWRSLGNSHFGMSLFFTLSGFVIAYNYLAMDWGNRAAVSAGRFAWLRFSRLYPVLLVYLALIYVRPSDYGEKTPAAVSLLLFSVESFYPFKINGHWLTDPLCWSISTELALYAMFAGGLVAFRKAKRCFGRPVSWIAAGVAILYLATMAWLLWHPQKIGPMVAALPAAFDAVPASEGGYWFLYWSPYARFYDFAFGCVAALAVIRGVRLPPWLAWAGPLGFGALWLAWVSGINDLNPMFFQPLSPPVFAVIMAASPRSRPSHALSAPSLLFFGEISYSLYLFHPFVTTLSDHARGQTFSWPGFAEFCGTFALDFVIAVALAAGLYRVIEMPAQKAMRRLIRFRSNRAEAVSADPASRQVRRA